MKFNIARQPLVPALLTLVAITVVAMWRSAAPADCTAENIAIPTHGLLAIQSAEELLCRFQTVCPLWASWIGGVLMLFTGLILGRLTIRYNLYSVGTCLPIPLYGAFVAGLIAGPYCLSSIIAATLLALSVRNFSRAFCNGYGFDAIFRASMYLGMLILVAPASLPLILLLPTAVILFHRTLRETVVALAGLLLPILAYGYVNWGAGGDFTSPFILAWEAYVNGSPLDAVEALPLQNLIFFGLVFLLDVVALFYFLADSFAAGNKPRTIFSFQIGLFVLFIPTMINPVSTTSGLLLAAVPSAVLIPFLLVRIHRLPTLILYLLILAGGIAIRFMQ